MAGKHLAAEESDAAPLGLKALGELCNRIAEKHVGPFAMARYDGLPGWEVSDASGTIAAVQVMNEDVARLLVETLNRAVA